MNISLRFLRLLKLRLARLSAEKKKTEVAVPMPDSSIDTTAYTMVDTILGGRRLDLMTSGYMDGKMLDQARLGHKSSKARWLKNKNEQTYKPRELRLDPQLEFYYEELGLSRNLGETIIGK